jgi:fibronectin type 3 domain-containing protein
MAFVVPAQVVAVTSAPGTASLIWTPPTHRTDGSAITNLAGYRIYYGTTATQLTQTIQEANPALSSYVVRDLTPATWYFVVTAYDATGAESPHSNMTTKVVQ